MSNGINLLPVKKQQSPAEAKDIKLLRMLSMGSLLIVVCLSVGVFFISALSPLESLKKQEAEASLKLDSLKTKALEYLITQKRLTEIETLVKSRPDYPNALTSMTKDNPQEITFSGIEIDGNAVSVIAKSSSLVALDSLIQSLLQRSDSDKLYSNLVLSSLKFDQKERIYTTELTVTVK